MISTKSQRDKIYKANPGYGYLIYNSGLGEITEIEVYVGRDNVLRRVVNDHTLFPISMYDENDNLVSVHCKTKNI